VKLITWQDKFFFIEQASFIMEVGDKVKGFFGGQLGARKEMGARDRDFR
jgi:hypothetical protein